MKIPGGKNRPCITFFMLGFKKVMLTSRGLHSWEATVIGSRALLSGPCIEGERQGLVSLMLLLTKKWTVMEKCDWIKKA